MESKEPTQQEQIENLAAHFFSKKNIILIMQLDNSKLPDGFNEMVLRGQLRSEYEIRQSIVSLAKGGSQPAQVQALEYIVNCKMEEQMNE